jgi:transposase-like protein
MSFVPPRCPNIQCSYHEQPVPRFYRVWGSFQPKCRTEPVPRFRCKHCRRTFSRQTFRHDYGDRRPELNAMLYELLVSGVGLRQSRRLLHMSVRAVQAKALKLGRTAHRLHLNLSKHLQAGRTYLLDEEETFETKSIWPVTMPVLIEKDSWFVVASDVGSIRRLAAGGTARRAAQDADENGSPRQDESPRAVAQVLTELANRVPEGPLVLCTDAKSTYGPIARRIFGDRLTHLQTSGLAPRTPSNPLFAINVTLAMTRDNLGRLRRRTWLVSKRRERLANHMSLFVAYRNYIRKRFNRDPEGVTSATVLGLLPRNLRFDEVLAWRQDRGDRSIHPMSLDASRTVRDSMAA